MIRKYISNFAEDVPEEYYITENQLDLFNDLDEDEFSVELVEEEEDREEEHASIIEYQVSSIESQVSNVESHGDKEASADPGKEEEDKPLTLF